MEQTQMEDRTNLSPPLPSTTVAVQENKTVFSSCDEKKCFLEELKFFYKQLHQLRLDKLNELYSRRVKQ